MERHVAVTLLESIRDLVVEWVEGGLVAFAPGGDVVLRTGAGPTDGLAAIRQRTRELVATGDHVVSPQLLQWAAGGWAGSD